MGYTWRTHGMTGTRFYRIWTKMQERCRNKNHVHYRDYGGRGISIRWSSFEAFKNDMYRSYTAHCRRYGENNTTLDRIDVNAGYSKANCRWVTKWEQQQNRRDSKILCYRGEALTQSQWARRAGISFSTLRSRIRQGWGIERALNTPVKYKQHDTRQFKRR